MSLLLVDRLDTQVEGQLSLAYVSLQRMQQFSSLDNDFGGRQAQLLSSLTQLRSRLEDGSMFIQPSAVQQQLTVSLGTGSVYQPGVSQH